MQYQKSLCRIDVRHELSLNLTYFNCMETIWNQDKIEGLILLSTEESIHLDFKSAAAIDRSDKKREDICKDVSSFANSDGGVIIYGIQEKNHQADAIDFVDGTVYTKEWLESVVNSGIHRRIDNICITPIRFDNDIRKTVYVVEIPVSPIAPHMVKNRYYKRFNFLSVAMEEYEVRQIYNRKASVKLQVGEISVGLSSADNTVDTSHLYFRIEMNLINIGNVPANDYRLKIFLSKNISIADFNNTEVNSTNGFLGGAISSINSPALFPGEELSVLFFTIGLPYKVFPKDIRLDCYLYSENGYDHEVHDITKELLKFWEEGLTQLERIRTTNMFKNSNHSLSNHQKSAKQ